MCACMLSLQICKNHYQDWFRESPVPHLQKLSPIWLAGSNKKNPHPPQFSGAFSKEHTYLWDSPRPRLRPRCPDSRPRSRMSV